MVHCAESCKGIPLARVVTLALKKSLEKFRSVGNQDLGKMVYRRNGEDGILPNIGVSMLQTRSGGRKERLNQFRFSKLTQESKSVASNIFIGML